MLTGQLEYTRAHVGLRGPCGVALNDDARVSADVDMRLIVGLTLDCMCA